MSINNSISSESYARIIAGISDLSLRASNTTIPESAANFARAARDLVTVAQAFKANTHQDNYILRQPSAERVG